MHSLRRILSVGFVLLGISAVRADTTFTYTLSGSQATLTGFTSSATAAGELTIPATVDGYAVVGIARGAFKNCTALTSVAFATGSGVTAVDLQAFQGCTGLTGITLPASLTVISAGAFLDCTGLTSVALPASVVEIEAAAFADCTKLRSISMPSGLTTIGESAFQGCSALVAVAVPSSVTTLPPHVFDGCSVLATIDLPGGLVAIGDEAFARAARISTLTLPDAVVSVGPGAFRECKAITTISFGTKLVSLGDGALAGCEALANISVATGNSTYSSSAGVLFNASRTILLLAPEGLSSSFAVPATVTTISDNAFAHCRLLTGVTFPDALTEIRAGAFYQANGLTTIALPESLASVGAWAFGGCDALTAVTLPASLSALGDNAFCHASRLVSATFNGNAPTTGTGIFDRTASSFTVYYVAQAAGFTSPTWLGYPSVCLGTPAVVSEPAVTTGSVSAGLTTASVSGAVTSANGATIVTRGFVYATSPNPALSTGSTVSAGDGLGTFSATLTGLSPGSVYHVRAYATNAVGTGYGEDVTFTTVASFAAPASDGYATGVTGGSAGTVVVVATAADFATYATSSQPHVITVVGNLTVGTVSVASNKTLQGADSSATLTGCLKLEGVSDIVIRGLNLFNLNGHALQFSGATKVYVTHCTFMDCAGEQVLATNSDQLTISWCEFAAATAGQSAVLLGSATETGTPRVTLHHNWWSTGLGAKLPAAASGSIHQYSDYLAATGNSSGTSVSGVTQLLSEGNVYAAMADPLAKSGTAAIRTNGNVYNACTGNVAAGTDVVATPGYSYELLAAGDVPTAISTLAGNTAGAASPDPDCATVSISATATTVNAGSSCTLTSSLSGASAATYQWRLGNAPVSGATGASYTIASMSSSTAGTYTVAVGLADGATVISTPLVLTLGSSTTTTDSGSNASNTSAASGGGGGGACGTVFYIALFALALARRRRAG